MGHACGNIDNDRAGGGHAGDGHVVGGATARHGGRGCPGRASEGHIAGGEIRDGFIEYHGEVDRRKIGRVKLTDGLVDGDRQGSVVVRDGVIQDGAGGIGVGGRVVGHTCSNIGNDRSGTCHPTDGHIVGGAVVWRNLRHGAKGCPGRAGQGHIAGGEIRDGFIEYHGEIDRCSVGRVKLTGGLVDGQRQGGVVVIDGVVKEGGCGIGVVGHIVGHAGGNIGNDRSGTCHPTDSHVVGGAVVWRNLRHSAQDCPGRTGEGHIAGGEIRDCFTEHYGEVDRRNVGGVKLTGGLVDRHTWGSGVGGEGGRFGSICR